MAVPFHYHKWLREEGVGPWLARGRATQEASDPTLRYLSLTTAGLDVFLDFHRILDSGVSPLVFNSQSGQSCSSPGEISPRLQVCRTEESQVPPLVLLVTTEPTSTFPTEQRERSIHRGLPGSSISKQPKTKPLRKLHIAEALG